MSHGGSWALCPPVRLVDTYYSFLIISALYIVSVRTSEMGNYALFIPCIMRQLLQYRTNQMHTYYNFISQSIFYVLGALKAHHQEANFFYVLLTVHLSIFILVINQLYAQNLFYNKFISCLYMFRAPCAHRQEIKNCIIRPPIGVMIPEAV